MKKVLLIGNFGVPNLGDELILESEIAQLAGKYKITVLCPFPKKVRKKYGVEAEYLPPLGLRSGLKFWRWGIAKNVIKKSDLVVLAGGGLLRDGYSWFLWAMPIFLAFSMRKRVVFWAVDFTGVRNWFFCLLTRALLRKAVCVTVRDDVSKKFVENCGVVTKKVCDPAENLKWVAKNGKKSKNVVLAPRAGFSHVVTWENVAKNLENRGWTVFWLACQTGGMENDVDFIEKCGGCVRKAQNFDEMNKMMAKMDLAVCARLHAGIVANACDVRTVAVPYAAKVETMMRERGVEIVEEGILEEFVMKI